MQPIRHDIPKHHQDRTWRIYGKSVPQLFLERVAQRPDAGRLPLQGLRALSGSHVAQVSRRGRSVCARPASRSASRPATASRSWAIPATNISSPTWPGSASARSPTASTRPARPAEVRHQLENAGARLFIAENQEYVDKVLELEESDAAICASIIVGDMRAMFLYRDDRIHELRGRQGARARIRQVKARPVRATRRRGQAGRHRGASSTPPAPPARRRPR